jgi:hypothetical protein
MLIPLMDSDLSGIKTLGRIMGIILVADGLAESLMPMMVGALYKTTNNYILGFSVLIAIAVTGAIIVSFLQKGKIEKGTKELFIKE